MCHAIVQQHGKLNTCRRLRIQWSGLELVDISSHMVELSFFFSLWHLKDLIGHQSPSKKRPTVQLNWVRRRNLLSEHEVREIVHG